MTGTLWKRSLAAMRIFVVRQFRVLCNHHSDDKDRRHRSNCACGDHVVGRWPGSKWILGRVLAKSSRIRSCRSWRRNKRRCCWAGREWIYSGISRLPRPRSKRILCRVLATSSSRIRSCRSWRRHKRRCCWAGREWIYSGILRCPRSRSERILRRVLLMSSKIHIDWLPGRNNRWCWSPANGFTVAY